jgi:transposase
MKFSKAEIKQLTPSYIERLNQEQLANLCKGVVADLVEAHDRLNANSSNSSKPPRTDSPWDRPSDKNNKSENEENDDPLPGDDVDSKDSSSDDQEELKVLPVKGEKEENPTPKKKPGKQQNAQGFGRTQKLIITRTEIHKPCKCKSCTALFDDKANFTATGGHYVVDIELPKEGEIGLRGSYTKHLYGKTLCLCGFETHTSSNYIPPDGEWSVALSEASLVGPMLLAFICFLKYRMHATGSKVQALLRWFGLSLSIGCINKCFREAGRAVSPLEPQLLSALRAAGLLHVDETSWYNRKVVRWLWVFCNDGLVYYSIASRGQEVIDSILEGFKGILMTDGYRVYRKLTNRIRCWPHLERKGKALEESWDKQATNFGKFVVSTFVSLRECVYKLRELPEELRSELKDQAQQQKSKLLYECMQNLDSTHEKTSQMAYEILNDNQAIFRVLEEPELPTSNNQAEQQFRYLAILRQITYGSKSEEGCRALALTASVVDTMLQLGCDAYKYLATVFDLRRKGSDPPPMPFPVPSG